jgi:diadenylate cyclase
VPEIFTDLGPKEIFDIALVALFAYGIILWIKRAKAGLAFTGILLLGGFYFVAREIGLQLTAFILQGFFALILIMLVVLFQRELRQLFERIAVWSLRRNAGSAASNETVLCLVEALSTLARRKHGALVVLPGKDPLDRHVEGGVDLGGRVSSPLLMSLFDPDSVGHDGALIVEGDTVTRFSVHLPLSRNFEQLGQRGTRHSAALGLAERTDALCIVVSEERGEISIAQDYMLRLLRSPDELETELQRFVQAQRDPHAERRTPWSVLTANWIEKIAAAGLALGLWVIFISGGQGVRQQRAVPVLVDNAPPGFQISSVQPKEVQVTLSGPRREFYVLAPGALEVRVDGFLAGLGRKTFPIGPLNVRHPEGLTVLDVTPSTVEIVVTRTGEDAAAEKAAPQGSAE